MPGVAISSISDLINHCLPHFKDFGAFNATFESQNYEVFDQWFRENVYRVSDGNKIEWRICYSDNGSFRFVQLHERTPINFVDVMSKGSADWCFAEAKVNWEARVLKMKRNKSAITNYLKEQWFSGLKSMVKGIDASGFGKPNDTSDTRTPLGVPMWIQFANTGVTNYDGDFIGRSALYGDGTLSTSANIGGIDRATQTMGRNWACNKTGINMATIEAMMRAKVFCQFTPPRSLREYIKWKKPMFRIYSSLDEEVDYRRLVNAGPDNRNGDLMPFSGVLNFLGMEWMGLPQLQGASYNPLYMLDMSKIFPFVHSDWWMAKTEAMNDREAPHEYTVQIDCQYNFACENPREAGAVFHDPT